jgi:uncharacterized membrane protein
MTTKLYTVKLLLGISAMARSDSSQSFSPIGFLPGATNSLAYAITADGATVVGQISTTTDSKNDTQAFRWTAQDGIVKLGDLPGGCVCSFAYGVFNDGQTIVGTGNIARALNAYKTEAFRWTSTGGMEGLGFLPGKTD